MKVDVALSLSVEIPDDELTSIVADAVARALAEHGPVDDAWLAPDAAARYLGVKRKRLYDLKSMGAIEPDGFDGRTPLFTRATLDAYARSIRVAPTLPQG